MWNFLDEEISGSTIASCVGFDPFGIGVHHPNYINGTLMNLGPLPTVIINFPFILLWVSIIGNLILFILVFKKNNFFH